MPQFDHVEPAPQTIEISEPVAAAPPWEETVQPLAPEPAQPTVASEPVEAPPAAQPQPEAPAPAQNATVITQADPAQPKKGGWWQRARASLGGDN